MDVVPHSHPGAVPPAPRPRAVILSDVRLYREGMASSLAGRSDIDVVAGMASAPDLKSQVAAVRPDVVLVDVALSSFRDLARSLAETMPKVPLIAFALAEHGPDVVACAEAGMTGYLEMGASAQDLVTVIHSVLRGEFPCSPRIAAYLLRHIAELGGKDGQHRELAGLTTRERDVVRLLDGGLSNKQIARELEMSSATVKNHVHNILDKLKVSRRGEAAALIRSGARRPAALDQKAPVAGS